MSKKKPTPAPPAEPQDAGEHALPLDSLGAVPAADAIAVVAEEPAPPPVEPEAAESSPHAPREEAAQPRAEDGNEGTSEGENEGPSEGERAPEPVAIEGTDSLSPSPDLSVSPSPTPPPSCAPCVKVVLRRVWRNLPAGTPLALVQLTPDIPQFSLNQLVDLVRNGFATDRE